ncbi:hypothetical protein [Urechidicola vernalis]|uniref:Uncharacterized protein n=1 Tax=Urechidicola vernalis TaxID=3075600 RepID=A0ABU2Y630_9FLAO|nr:hypothetical protein [Urechidicola sp. P050]MDT0553497.1 hypothetical protein [Urechidicola sp. P050]
MVGIILISNILPIRVYTEGVIIPYHFETKHSEFEFIAYPSKGRGTEEMDKKFKKFIKENPQTKDTTIYRSFSRNALKFWNWRFYFTSDLYNYELKN